MCWHISIAPITYFCECRDFGPDCFGDLLYFAGSIAAPQEDRRYHGAQSPDCRGDGGPRAYNLDPGVKIVHRPSPDLPRDTCPAQPLTGNGAKPTFESTQPGCCSVALLAPPREQRPERRSTSLDAPAPQRTMNGASAAGRRWPQPASQSIQSHGGGAAQLAKSRNGRMRRGHATSPQTVIRAVGTSPQASRRAAQAGQSPSAAI